MNFYSKDETPFLPGSILLKCFKHFEISGYVFMFFFVHLWYISLSVACCPRNVVGMCLLFSIILTGDYDRLGQNYQLFDEMFSGLFNCQLYFSNDWKKLKLACLGGLS